MRTSSAITETVRRMYWPKCLMIDPETLIRTLNRAKVDFVLMGTYGISGWRSEERATEDVDFLVRAKDHGKAVTVIRKSYDELVMDDQIVVTRFADPATGKVILDLMKPTEKILKAVFRHTIAVGRSHRIPALEMALAVKFAAMVSPNRRPDKKLIDAGDFVNIVMRNRKNIDLPKLKRFGEMVYPAGGKEIAQLVQDIDAGRQIRL